MYQIRGLKSSMDKITYPVGIVLSAGVFSTDKTFKFQGRRYRSNILFTEDTNADHGFELVSKNIEYTNSKTNKTHYKTVSVQPRISNNGSLLPHNTSDRYLGPNYWGGVGGYYYMNQKLSMHRNAVVYSPVNEVMVFQADLVNNLTGGEFELGTYVDYRFYENNLGKITAANYNIPEAAKLSGIIDPDSELDTIVRFKDASGTTLFNSKNHWESSRAEYEYFNVDNDTDINYKYIDLAISANDIKTHIQNVSYVVGSYFGRFNLARLEITEDMKTHLLAGANKFNYVYLKLLISNTAGHFNTEESTKVVDYRKALLKSMQHQSDFLPEETIIDSAGEFIVLKFNRPTVVDIFFNNDAYEYDKVSDLNHEIRIIKKTTPFTVGGTLTITQKHKFQAGSYTNRTFTFPVPDTVAPNPPTFGMATRNTITGNAIRDDIVYVEREDIVLGSSRATTTGTFEITLTDTIFNNNDIVTLYTKDTAGNKSTLVTVTLTDIASENAVSLNMNSDILNMS